MTKKKEKNLDEAIEEAAAENTDADTDSEGYADGDQKPQPEYTMETCKVDFTPEELKELSEELARNIGEKSDKDDEKKTVVAQFKAEIEVLENAIALTAVKVRNKFEYQLVKCEVLRDYTAKEIHWIRLDTGELHRGRTMRAGELQPELPV